MTTIFDDTKDRDDVVALLLVRGEHALREVGDLRAARHWFARACVLAERVGDANALASAALGLGGLWVNEHREVATWAQVTSWQRRALALTGVQPRIVAQLTVRLAAEEDYREGRQQGVLAVLGQIRRSDDPRSLAMALSLAHHCLLGPEHRRLRADLADELLLAAARTAHRTDRLMGLLWRTVDLFLDGDPHAGRSLRELRSALETRDHQAIGFVVQAMSVMLMIRSGDLTGAEELAAECARRGEVSGDADAAGWYQGQLLAIRWFQGRVGELLPVLSLHVHAAGLSVLDDSLVAALAAAAAAEGDELLAIGALARLGRGDLADLPSSSTWMVTLYGAIEAAARLGDTATAATAYDLLLPYGRLPMMASLAVACFGSVQQALGVAALTMGETDRAVAHLDSAVRDNLALGHWPAHCLSRHRLAQALLLRGGPEDRAEARREQAGAQSEARRLGMALPALDIPAELAPQPSNVTVVRPGETEYLADKGVLVRVLGPVDVMVDGAVRLISGLRRRTVLAVLAMHAGEVVSADRLIDIVWGEDGPQTAANTLQSHMSFLRRVIGDRAGVRARAGGYLLDLGPEAADVTRAERLIAAGLRSQAPDDVVRQLQEALGMWRGQPMKDIAGGAWAEDQAQRLGLLRLTAQKHLAQARLTLGEHVEVTAELGPLTREHPLDEQIHEYLILALYRQGLQSRALEVYEQLRSALRDELGISPSTVLRRLHESILHQEVSPGPALSGQLPLRPVVIPTTKISSATCS